MVAHKMLLIEMAGQRFIVLEPLVVGTLFFANVALVVFLVQVLIEEIDIVKPFRAAKFANRVAGKPRAGPVSVFQMVLQLAGGESGKLRHKVALVIYAQLAHRKPVFLSKVVLQYAEGLPLLFLAAFVVFVVAVVILCALVVVLVDLKVAFLARKFVKRHNGFLVVFLLKEHANVGLVHKAGPDFIAPPGVAVEGFRIVAVHNDGIVRLLANGAFFVLVQVAQPQVANSAHVVVAAWQLCPHVRFEAAETNNADMVSVGLDVDLGIRQTLFRHGGFDD